LTLSIEAVIWGMLAILAFTATFMVVERFLFFLAHSAADPVALGDWLKRSKRGVITWPRYRFEELGWLGPQLDAAGNNRLELHRRCVGFRKDAERFGTLLAAIPNLAQMAGLLGTAAGIGKCRVGVSDPYALMGLAIETTKCGLVIAIPTLLALAVFSKLNRGLDEQLRLVFKRLNESSGPRRKQTGAERQAGRLEPLAPLAAHARCSRPAAKAETGRDVGAGGNHASHGGNGRVPVVSRPRAEDVPPSNGDAPVEEPPEAGGAGKPSTEEIEDARASQFNRIVDAVLFGEDDREEDEADEAAVSPHKGNGHWIRGDERCRPY